MLHPRALHSQLAGHQKETACGQSCKDESKDSNYSVFYALFMQVPQCLLVFPAAMELFPN